MNTKTIHRVVFTVGEPVTVKGIEFILASFSKRGLILHRIPKDDKPWCPRCHGNGTVIGHRGNVEACPLNCPAGKTIMRLNAQWSEVEAALGLKPSGHSQDTGRRNPFSSSADDGIKDQT